jgi:hypothetical protein
LRRNSSWRGIRNRLKHLVLLVTPAGFEPTTFSLELSPAQERKYKKLKNEIIGEVKSLRLNRARIDALIEQLYEINKRLVGCEGRLLRLAKFT